MPQFIAQVSLLVHDYDAALAFYVGKLGFELLEDRAVPEQNKRFVRIAPPGSTGHAAAAGLVLARASTPEQTALVGRQAGGRVGWFLYTDDFWRDHAHYTARGVQFLREPLVQPYGTVAVFQDLYGNLWDLLQPSESVPPSAASAGAAPGKPHTTRR